MNNNVNCQPWYRYGASITRRKQYKNYYNNDKDNDNDNDVKNVKYDDDIDDDYLLNDIEKELNL